MLGVVRLPVAWGLVTRFQVGSDGIWYAFAVSNVVGAILAVLYYRRGTWRQADARTEPDVAPVTDD